MGAGKVWKLEITLYTHPFCILDIWQGPVYPGNMQVSPVRIGLNFGLCYLGPRSQQSLVLKGGNGDGIAGRAQEVGGLELSGVLGYECK